jgi:hypothetical protein
LDGVNVVVVVVTDERSEAVGVTIVEQDEVIDGYFVFDNELHNGRVSFVVIIDSDDGGINFDDSFIDRLSSSFVFPLIVE